MKKGDGGVVQKDTMHVTNSLENGEGGGLNEKRTMHLEKTLRFARVRGMPGRIAVQDFREIGEEAGKYGLGG